MRSGCRRESEDSRPSPEEFLRRLAAEERLQSRGKLKVFLGYASGTGKSARMFDEGRRRKQRGQDIVVVATQPEPSDSPQLRELLEQLEIIAPRVTPEGVAIDVPAVLQRRPEVVLVDGLAYENPPGSRHPHRWQDVEDLLCAGVSVITSVNLQYVEERQAQVAGDHGQGGQGVRPRVVPPHRRRDRAGRRSTGVLRGPAGARRRRLDRRTGQARAAALGAAGNRSATGGGGRRPAARATTFAAQGSSTSTGPTSGSSSASRRARTPCS